MIIAFPTNMDEFDMSAIYFVVQPNCVVKG